MLPGVPRKKESIFTTTPSHTRYNIAKSFKCYSTPAFCQWAYTKKVHPLPALDRAKAIGRPLHGETSSPSSPTNPTNEQWREDSAFYTALHSHTKCFAVEFEDILRAHHGSEEEIVNWVQLIFTDQPYNTSGDLGQPESTYGSSEEAIKQTADLCTFLFCPGGHEVFFGWEPSLFFGTEFFPDSPRAVQFSLIKRPWYF